MRGFFMPFSSTNFMKMLSDHHGVADRVSTYSILSSSVPIIQVLALMQTLATELAPGVVSDG
jgi:hypothetical protein